MLSNYFANLSGFANIDIFNSKNKDNPDLLIPIDRQVVAKITISYMLNNLTLNNKTKCYIRRYTKRNQ